MGSRTRDGGKAPLWALVVLGGAALVVAGLHLLRRAVSLRPEYRVIPRVTRIEAAPPWLGPLGKAHLVRLVEGAFPRSFQVFQAAPLRKALERIHSEGLAGRTRAERVLPSQVRLVLEVPRPVAFFRDSRGRAHVLDAWGRPLPFPLSGIKVSLPELTGLSREARGREGKERKEALRAGGAVARQVEESFLPALGRGFLLRAVDLSNLGYKLLADGERAEIRLVFQAPDGHLVTLEWDRSPFSPYGNIPLSQKIDVARKILAKYPGFQGVLGADLRWELRWEQWLTLAPPEGQAARGGEGK
ncbi:MAG TPA: hypothetical protein ENJ97_05825 [Planctomycetes bacterium]|nr:hypothetical protein [Planctomycetota bacterium]